MAWLKWLLVSACIAAVLGTIHVFLLQNRGLALAPAVSQEDWEHYRDEIGKLKTRLEALEARQSGVSPSSIETPSARPSVATASPAAQKPVQDEEQKQEGPFGRVVGAFPFEAGEPEVLYIPVDVEAPKPTAIPPPWKKWTEEERISPIVPLRHMRSMNSLGSCALIGSHAALQKRSLGNEIDAHDVVIRVNDVANFSQDVGYKTDIYFATMCKLHGVGKEFQSSGRHNSLRTYGTKRGPGCNYFCRPDVKTAGHDKKCPFKAFIISGINSSECTTSIKTRGYHSIQDIERHACYPTGYVNDAWSTEIQEIRRNNFKYWGRPTTGFHAIIVFGYLCQTLTLYGFGLDIKAHAVQEVHHADKERTLLHKLVQGILPDSDFPPVLREQLAAKARRRSIRFAFTQ